MRDAAHENGQPPLGNTRKKILTRICAGISSAASGAFGVFRDGRDGADVHPEKWQAPGDKSSVAAYHAEGRRLCVSLGASPRGDSNVEENASAFVVRREEVSFFASGGDPAKLEEVG